MKHGISDRFKKILLSISELCIKIEGPAKINLSEIVLV